MRYYRFLYRDTHVEPGSTDQFVMTEGDGTTWLYAPLSSDDEAESFFKTAPFARFEPVELKEYVDWGVQWSTHSPDFKDYSLQIDLSKYTSIDRQLPLLQLKAGPGFGDLSHPTTRLTLAMMAAHMQNKTVIDVGCGSGILTLAAVLLGATSACGIDIETDALVHARENAQLNSLQKDVHFYQPDEFPIIQPGEVVILMNMIRSHQRSAWESLPQLHPLAGTCISSGVLATERDIYLGECATRGWTLVDERQEGDWLAFEWALKGSGSSDDKA